MERKEPMPRPSTLKGIGLSAALIAGLLTAAPAGAMEGTYEVEGQSDGGSYSGRVRVAQTGDTYTILWLIGAERHLGTGILSGGQLSVVFVGGGIPGVAVYRRTTGETVVGVYSQLGGTRTAIETWTPVADNGAPPDAAPPR